MDSSIEGRAHSSEPQLAALLAAAGDPTRLRILSLLRSEACSVRRICEALESAQPRISHHLGILRRCGLLEVEVRGRERIYRWPDSPGDGPGGELIALLQRWLGESGTGRASRTPTADASTELEDFLL